MILKALQHLPNICIWSQPKQVRSQVQSLQQTLPGYYSGTLFCFYGFNIYFVWLSSLYGKWHWFSNCSADVKISFKIHVFGKHMKNIYPGLRNSTSGYFPTETCTYIHQKTWEECSNSPVCKSLELGISPNVDPQIYHVCSHNGIHTTIRRINNVDDSKKKNIEWKKPDKK